MSFTVVPDDLDEFARLLGRAGEDADAVHVHARRYGAIPQASKGLLARFRDTHQDLFDPLCTQLAELGQLFDDARVQVRRAATRYRSTDLEAVERLDSVLPPTKR